MHAGALVEPVHDPDADRHDQQIDQQRALRRDPETEGQPRKPKVSLRAKKVRTKVATKPSSKPPAISRC